MYEYSLAEIDILLAGYEIGYFSNIDLVKWADRQIEAIDEPSTELLDLSMIGQKHPLDALNLLQKLRGTSGSSLVNTRIGFIGLLLRQKRITMQAAIRSLYAMVHADGITEEQRSEIYYLDDAFDLADSGTHGTMIIVHKDLHDFVTPYAERLESTFPQLIPDQTSHNG